MDDTADTQLPALFARDVELTVGEMTAIDLNGASTTPLVGFRIRGDIIHPTTGTQQPQTTGQTADQFVLLPLPIATRLEAGLQHAQHISFLTHPAAHQPGHYDRTHARRTRQLSTAGAAITSLLALAGLTILGIIAGPVTAVSVAVSCAIWLLALVKLRELLTTARTHVRDNGLRSYLHSLGLHR